MKNSFFLKYLIVPYKYLFLILKTIETHFLVPSFYRLLVTEAHSVIRMCTDLDTESRLLSLFHIPVKDSGDFYSLGDITANGQSLDGNFINVLAAVRSVRNYGMSMH